MKNTFRTLPAFLFLSFLFIGLNAQMTPEQLVKKIRWDVRMEPSEGIKVGDLVTVYFDAFIEDGYHVYSVKPTDMGPLPTEIITDKISGAEAKGKSQEKNGELHTVFDELFGTDVYYYDTKVTFFQEYEVKKSSVALDGFIDFQVCSEDMCVPHSIPFSFNFQAAKK